LGTVVGGTIVTVGNIYLARSHEKLEFRTAARLISTELLVAQNTVKFAIDHHHWWRPDEKLKTEDWEKYNIHSHRTYRTMNGLMSGRLPVILRKLIF
jgi:hypothetical protein